MYITHRSYRSQAQKNTHMNSIHGCNRIPIVSAAEIRIPIRGIAANEFNRTPIIHHSSWVQRNTNKYGSDRNTIMRATQHRPTHVVYSSWMRQNTDGECQNKLIIYVCSRTSLTVHALCLQRNRTPIMSGTIYPLNDACIHHECNRTQNTDHRSNKTCMIHVCKRQATAIMSVNHCWCNTLWSYVKQYIHLCKSTSNITATVHSYIKSFVQ